MRHDFQQKLAFSKGKRQAADLETIKAMILGCVSVVATDEHTDREGIDYVATLRGGATINIDAKTREPGCSRYWRRHQPELALEIWSVKPSRLGDPRQKAGWTLSEKSNVDLVFYSFPPEDCDEVFLLPFQHLRIAFRTFYDKWKQFYDIKPQDNGTWTSEAMFVPASAVEEGIAAVSRDVERRNGPNQKNMF